MFDLVADVEAYPQFVPMCAALRVRSRAKDGQGRGTLVAEMDVGYKAIKATFASRVTLDREHQRISVDFLDGPFKEGGNRWLFEDLPAEQGGGSKIDFSISYEFSSRMLGMLMGSMFDDAFRRFAKAFEARADAIYGRQA